MLNAILDIYRPEIEALAYAWLVSGASRFGIRSRGRVLADWPPKSLNLHTPLCAPIALQGQTEGELFVCGMSGTAVQAKLDAQAAFLGRLSLTEHEMESVTAELVDTQDQLLALYNIVHSTHDQTTLVGLLTALAQATSQLFTVDTAFVWFEKSQGERLIAQAPKAVDKNALVPLIDQVLTHDRQLLSNGRPTTTLLLPYGINSILILPLHIQNHPLAAIGIINKKNGAFGSPAIKLLETVAQYAESQIENTLLHEAQIAQTRSQTEMDMARTVQMNLMPQKLPQLPCLEMAAACRPALSVGGDFYDCLKQPDDSLFIALGDVSGKGMSAALLMAMTRTTMRNALRLLPNNSLQTFIDRTNEVLYDDFTDVGMFATLFIANWQPRERRMTYVNAGHTPVIHRPAGGPAYLMEVTGAPLCVLPVNLATTEELAFGCGDVLVAATDGFNEARNEAGEMFDYARLIALIDSLADRPAAEIVQAVFETITEFSQGHAQEDDQTILVIKGMDNNGKFASS